MTGISAAPFPFLFYMADQMLGLYSSVQTSIKRHKNRNPEFEKKILVLKKRNPIRQEQIHVACL